MMNDDKDLKKVLNKMHTPKLSDDFEDILMQKVHQKAVVNKQKMHSLKWMLIYFFSGLFLGVFFVFNHFNLLSDNQMGAVIILAIIICTLLIFIVEKVVKMMLYQKGKIDIKEL
ncbi:hypothetical protein MY04_1720 [Flammeovirga sp. MY04]|uniref:hypothetical protein n=1 Tax=Flammeovirga sp. MY04 TaxID=1191459 RepID=UPI0008061470|nr:hypothetical protein [Flammeovirga sp. MY04]ANQ49094.1 hypothetical protein MY04_1720 [Flammeovirga sp. MY04]